jgi:hypothetical protein
MSFGAATVDANARRGSEVLGGGARIQFFEGARESALAPVARLAEDRRVTECLVVPGPLGAFSRFCGELIGGHCAQPGGVAKKLMTICLATIRRAALRGNSRAVQGVPSK